MNFIDQNTKPASQFANKVPKKREWIVEGLIPKGVNSLLVGEGGVGKSSLALGLGALRSTNKSWLGLETHSGATIIISAEDDLDELHRRLDRICLHHEIAMEELDDLHLLPIVGEKFSLFTRDEDRKLEPTETFNQLSNKIQATNADLLVFDTLPHFFHGNENDRGDVTDFLNNLAKLARLHDCAILLLAHPSKDIHAGRNSYSGSTAWQGSVRNKLNLVTDQKNDGFVELFHSKSNYGLQLQKIELLNDRGVFRRVEEKDILLDRTAAKIKFLNLLKYHCEHGIPVSASPGRNYAPSVFASHHMAEEFTSKVLKQAMHELLQQKRIEVKEEGPPSKRRKTLVICHFELSANEEN